MSATPHRTDLTDRVLMNKLRVVRLVGEGGMGAVYEVEHLITRHRRALKVMHSSYASSPETIARFVREAGVAGTLKTPHVVETYDAGQLDDGSPYVLMELLEGRTLGGLFESGEKVHVGRLVGLICQVLEGLDVAHRAGIVHRDIKPDNVFVGVGQRDMPRVTLLDFGISKFLDTQFDVNASLTAEGAMMGTPYYMSLEQASGRVDIDVRSDLYSVGVMLYEGLVGQKPYEATSLTALVVKIHEGDHITVQKAAPHIPVELANVVEKAMAVRREDRYQTASELLAALVPFADSRYVVSLHTLRLSNNFDKTIDATTTAAITKPRAASAPPPPPQKPLWPKLAALGAVAAISVGAYVVTREPSATPEAIAPEVTPPVVVPEVTQVAATPEVTQVATPEVPPVPEVTVTQTPVAERPHTTRVRPETPVAQPETRPSLPPETQTTMQTVETAPPVPVETTMQATMQTEATTQMGGRLELDRTAFE
jgi:serine/threonine protein kinase